MSTPEQLRKVANEYAQSAVRLKAYLGSEVGVSYNATASCIREFEFVAAALLRLAEIGELAPAAVVDDCEEGRFAELIPGIGEWLPIGTRLYRLPEPANE